MSQTKLGNLINPEVMGNMISATLKEKIKFSKIAKVDTTLSEQPGNTITVPCYNYIGDAEDVAEGVAMGTSVLTATTTQATVKKVGKAVELTDESVLSGYGDIVGETKSQIQLSIAAKIDNDCLDALYTSRLNYDGSSEVISYKSIVNAVDVFEDEADNDTEKIMFVHPKQVTQLRLDEDFRDVTKYPLNMVMTGVVGEICGCQIIKSKKVKAENGCYLNPIVIIDTQDIKSVAQGTEEKPITEGVAPALTIYMKRNVELESDRDILAKTTVISADEHYTVALSNEAKVVIAKMKA
ncbi:MAG: N4-gp56 family major capsid protein [Lachnospirales bacterium]